MFESGAIFRLRQAWSWDVDKSVVRVIGTKSVLISFAIVGDTTWKANLVHSSNRGLFVAVPQMVEVVDD